MANQTRPSHQCQFRVYYEDTDAGGVVYYANYLKFAERARTEMLRDAGIHQSQLTEKEGLYFVVRNVEAEFKRPARLDDHLDIQTHIISITGPTIEMTQLISKNEALLVSLSVKIICIDKKFTPKRIPASIHSQLTGA